MYRDHPQLIRKSVSENKEVIVSVKMRITNGLVLDEISVEERIRSIRLAIEEYKYLEKKVEDELEKLSVTAIDKKR